MWNTTGYPNGDSQSPDHQIGAPADSSKTSEKSARQVGELASLRSPKTVGLNPTSVIGTVQLGDALQVGELLIGKLPFPGNTERRDHPHQSHAEVGVILPRSIPNLGEDLLHGRLQR